MYVLSMPKYHQLTLCLLCINISKGFSTLQLSNYALLFPPLLHAANFSPEEFLRRGGGVRGRGRNSHFREDLGRVAHNLSRPCDSRL